MKKEITERILEEANYIIKTEKTMREIASDYNVSKSTVHKDLSERLKKVDYSLSKNVDEIIQDHLDTRHLRGGEVTRQRYKGRKL